MLCKNHLDEILSYEGKYEGGAEDRRKVAVEEERLEGEKNVGGLVVAGQP